jgi:hypothetical protein
MSYPRGDPLNYIIVSGWFIKSLGIEQAVFIAAIAAAAFGGSRAFARSLIDDQRIEVLDIFRMVDRGLNGAFHGLRRCSGDPILRYKKFGSTRSPVVALASSVEEEEIPSSKPNSSVELISTTAILGEPKIFGEVSDNKAPNGSNHQKFDPRPPLIRF